MKSKFLIIGSILILSLTFLFFSLITKQKRIYDPEIDGFVPNEETAIKIAEAIWLPVYGEEIINYRPYYAKLINGKVWIVKGRLKSGLGGVPYLEIQKSDCKILKINHGK